MRIQANNYPPFVIAYKCDNLFNSFLKMSECIRQLKVICLYPNWEITIPNPQAESIRRKFTMKINIFILSHLNERKAKNKVTGATQILYITLKCSESIILTIQSLSVEKRTTIFCLFT